MPGTWSVVKPKFYRFLFPLFHSHITKLLQLNNDFYMIYFLLNFNPPLIIPGENIEKLYWNSTIRYVTQSHDLEQPSRWYNTEIWILSFQGLLLSWHGHRPVYNINSSHCLWLFILLSICLVCLFTTRYCDIYNMQYVFFYCRMWYRDFYHYFLFNEVV